MGRVGGGFDRTPWSTVYKAGVYQEYTLMGWGRHRNMHTHIQTIIHQSRNVPIDKLISIKNESCHIYKKEGYQVGNLFFFKNFFFLVMTVFFLVAMETFVPWFKVPRCQKLVVLSLTVKRNVTRCERIRRHMSTTVKYALIYVLTSAVSVDVDWGSHYR